MCLHSTNTSANKNRRRGRRCRAASGLLAPLLLSLSTTLVLVSPAQAVGIFQPPQSLDEHCDPTNFQLPQQLTDVYSATFGGPPGTVPGPPLQIFATVAGLKEGWTPGLNLYETPIAVRFTHLIDVLNWNCAAVYSSGWYDALTKTDPVLRVPSEVPTDTGSLEMHTSDNRLMCMINGWTTVVKDWVPEAETPLFGILGALGFNAVQNGYNSQIDALFDITGPTGDIIDLDAAHDLAAAHCYSPQIIGAIIGRQMTEYARRDGYNMFGDLNRDSTPCLTNCHRYTDPTGYYPVHTEATSNGVRNNRWKPLVEDNGRGYETTQQHVTPHIGKLAKPAILTRSEIDARYASKPNYNYDSEARGVVERLRTMALNENNEKEKIEFFDDKIKVSFKVIEAVANHGTSLEQILNYVVGLTASEYDATLVAWNVKVENDLVRPTTWIRDEMSEEWFETYGGPYQGVKSIQGKNFDCWVRVMPHSEYVSGSGCICEAIKDFTDGWMQLTDGQLVGPGPSKYESGVSIAVPLATDNPGGREAPFLAGSSKTEPGLTPATDVTLVMNSMTELRDACGESRLDGGMHFSGSVLASYDLCQGIGTQGANFALSLLGGVGWTGQSSDFARLGDAGVDPEPCLADWAECTNDKNGCCSGRCEGNEFYMQCKPAL